MAYTWTNGELITAEKLNQTGNKPIIVNMEFEIGSGQYNVKLTSTAVWDDLVTAFKNGTTIMIQLPNTEQSVDYGLVPACFPLTIYTEAYRDNEAFFDTSNFYQAQLGTFNGFYKSDEGYLYANVYVD